MCRIFAEPSATASTYDASLLTTERTTTGAKDDEAFIILAASDEAEAARFVVGLGVLAWAHASGEVQADSTSDASSVVNDDDQVDVESLSLKDHVESPRRRRWSRDDSNVTDEDDDQRVTIVAAATPPDIKVKHDTAKRLAGLRHVRKLMRCQLHVYADDDHLLRQQHKLSGDL
jgi:hypothetical protein